MTQFHRRFRTLSGLRRLGMLALLSTLLVPSLAHAQADGEGGVAPTAEEESPADAEGADAQPTAEEESPADAEGADATPAAVEESPADAEGVDAEPAAEEQPSTDAAGAEAETAADEESPAAAEEPPADAPRERPYWIRAVGEVGMLAVMGNKIQFGRDGTYFDYTERGSEDNLYFVGRMGIELGLYRHHQIIFVYQPLFLRTEGILTDSLVVDGLEFPAGTPMSYRYDFPFYRLSYLYDFFGRRDLEVAIGLTLQLRNANISFASQDGSLFRDNRNIGLVPALKLRVTYYFPNGFWIGTEIDGMYAPVSYLNGDNNDVVGAILDASLRAGLTLPHNVQVFLNIRYLGGGAKGQGDSDELSDGWVRNWLHFLTVTIGVNWDII